MNDLDKYVKTLNLKIDSDFKEFFKEMDLEPKLNSLKMPINHIHIIDKEGKLKRSVVDYRFRLGEESFYADVIDIDLGGTLGSIELETVDLAKLLITMQTGKKVEYKVLSENLKNHIFTRLEKELKEKEDIFMISRDAVNPENRENMIAFIIKDNEIIGYSHNRIMEIFSYSEVSNRAKISMPKFIYNEAYFKDKEEVKYGEYCFVIDNGSKAFLYNISNDIDIISQDSASESIQGMDNFSMSNISFEFLVEPLEVKNKILSSINYVKSNFDEEKNMISNLSKEMLMDTIKDLDEDEDKTGEKDIEKDIMKMGLIDSLF